MRIRAKTLTVTLALLAIAGCGNTDPRTSRLKPGDQVILVQDGGPDDEYLYFGPTLTPFPIGTKATVAAEDESKPFRSDPDSGLRKVKVQINEGKFSGKVAEFVRSNLRPVK
jgi:hypothetical protein